jgi:hypothetical protein
VHENAPKEDEYAIFFRLLRAKSKKKKFPASFPKGLYSSRRHRNRPDISQWSLMRYQSASLSYFLLLLRRSLWNFIAMESGSSNFTGAWDQSFWAC